MKVYDTKCEIVIRSTLSDEQRREVLSAASSVLEGITDRVVIERRGDLLRIERHRTEQAKSL